MKATRSVSASDTIAPVITFDIFFLRKVVQGCTVIWCSLSELTSDDVSKNIGHLQYCVINDVAPPHQSAYISAVSVKQEHQNKGVGKRLFQHTLQDIKNNYPFVKYIKLDAVVRVTDAHNLYYQLGMRYVDKEKGPEMIGILNKLLKN